MQNHSLDEPVQKKQKASHADDSPSYCSEPSTLYAMIQQSTDRLFFVNYVADGTINPKLHLVQVNLIKTD
jgi:hypothetical protein